MVGSNFAFVVVRDFYGTTQVVIENEDLIAQVKGINKESTISVEGTVRARSNPIRSRIPEKLKSSRKRLKFLADAGITSFRLKSTAAVRQTNFSV